MYRIGNVFYRAAELDNGRKFRYHVGRPGAHELCADEFSVHIGNELDYTEVFTHYHRAPVASNVKSADLILDAMRLELILRKTYEGDLGICVYAGGDDAVIHDLIVTGGVCCGNETLCGSNVSKLYLARDIADGVNIFDIGAAMIVDNDEVAVELDPKLLKTYPAGLGLSADADDAARAFGGLDGAVQFVTDGDRISALYLCDLGVVDYRDLLLFKHAQAGPDDIGVCARKNRRHHFDDGNGLSERRKQRCELNADNAAADNNESLRQ